MSAGDHLTVLDGRFWRMLAVAWDDDLLGPARAREGRFHRNGQRAIYLSATPAGCATAIRRYLWPGDGDRAIYPLHVRSNRIVDLRDPVATEYFAIDTSDRAAEWQADRAAGRPAPTWAIADRVRALDLDGMLYASRSDPSLTHLTLLRWNAPGRAAVEPDGAALPWQPDA